MRFLMYSAVLLALGAVATSASADCRSRLTMLEKTMGGSGSSPTGSASSGSGSATTSSGPTGSTAGAAASAGTTNADTAGSGPGSTTTGMSGSSASSASGTNSGGSARSSVAGAGRVQAHQHLEAARSALASGNERDCMTALDQAAQAAGVSQ
jgi:hypothetical protein